MYKKLQILFKGGFVRNVGILVGGTAFSQLITISALPILTRLYTPEDFSVLAVYTAILSLITVVVCLRFNIAIALPKDDVKAKNLLVLSLLSVLLITVLSIILIVLLSTWIHKITQNRLIGYLWMLPFGAFLSGICVSFQYWSTREKKFKLITKSKMTQALSGTSTQIGFGYFGFTPVGLLIGQILNVGAGTILLVKDFRKNNKNVIKQLNKKDLKETFKEYDKFPKYSTFEGLANSATVQVPILLIASYLAGPEVGYIMLAIRLLAAPMGLIGSAVAQVYLSEAAQKYYNGSLSAFTNKTVIALLKVGSPPLIFAGITAPFLVPIIFGENWSRAGILISWMSPWFLLQFISSPVSMVLHITGNQKLAFLLQLLGLLVRGGGVLLAGLFMQAYIGEIFAITGAIFYLIYLLVILMVLKKI